MSSVNDMTKEEVASNPIRLMFKEFYAFVTDWERRMMATAAAQKSARVLADLPAQAEGAQKAADTPPNAKLQLYHNIFREAGVPERTPYPATHVPYPKVYAVKYSLDSMYPEYDSDVDTDFDSDFEASDSDELNDGPSYPPCYKHNNSYKTNINVGPDVPGQLELRVVGDVVFVDAVNGCTGRRRCIRSVTMPRGYDWANLRSLIRDNGQITLRAYLLKPPVKPKVYREFMLYPCKPNGELVLPKPAIPSKERTDDFQQPKLKEINFRKRVDIFDLPLTKEKKKSNKLSVWPITEIDETPKLPKYQNEAVMKQRFLGTHDLMPVQPKVHKNKSRRDPIDPLLLPVADLTRTHIDDEDDHILPNIEGINGFYDDSFYEEFF